MIKENQRCRYQKSKDFMVASEIFFDEKEKELLRMVEALPDEEFTFSDGHNQRIKEILADYKRGKQKPHEENT